MLKRSRSRMRPLVSTFLEMESQIEAYRNHKDKKRQMRKTKRDQSEPLRKNF